jgi:hypothetical protein
MAVLIRLVRIREHTKELPMLDTLLRRLRLQRRAAGTQSRAGKDRPANAPREADGAPLPFRPDLIAELTHEHRLLESAFASLVEAHHGGDVETCIFRLRTFTNLLRAHLLNENLQLYRYLRLALSAAPGQAMRSETLRREMQDIGRTLNAFTNAYLGATWNEARRKMLGRDLIEIGQILAQRIETEERALYPLYLAPDRD